MIILPNKGIKNQTEPKPQINITYCSLSSFHRRDFNRQKAGTQNSLIPSPKMPDSILLQLMCEPVLPLVSSVLRQTETPLLNGVEWGWALRATGSIQVCASPMRCTFCLDTKKLEAGPAASNGPCPSGSAPALHASALWGKETLLWSNGLENTGTKLPAFLSPSPPLSFPSNTFLYSPGWI